MLRTLSYEPGFDEIYYEMSPTGRSPPPTAAGCRQARTTLRLIYDVLSEGLAASRQYEHLRSRGIPHDTALREALGIGPSPSHGTRENR
jgi:hypothetical protein